MKRIILHWTAGTGFPTSYEKKFYHFLVDKNGKTHLGEYEPEANLDVKSGRYAAHTGGGNTGSIGVAACGMAGFVSANDAGKYPLTRVQLEAVFALCASLCDKYSIPVTPSSVMTHYEFGLKNPTTTSAGKVDLTYLSPFPELETRNIGGFIRSKVNWYRLKSAQGQQKSGS